MIDKLSDLIQVRLNAIDRLGLNSIARRASAHVYGEWKERAEALEQRAEGLVEDLENAYLDRTQLLEAVQFALTFLPEHHGNIRVRAKLEMALTDLIAAEEEV